MIFLILVLSFVIISLAITLLGNFHGYAGAIILGVNAVVMDLLWQWLRIKLMRQSKTSSLLWGIFGGLIIRVASIFLFIQTGLWWLGKATAPFYVFAIFLLTIPIWSIIASFIFKLERN